MLHRLQNRIPKPVRNVLRERFYPPMLREGESAPEWRLLGSDGAWHQPGDHWSILVFYPGDSTPGCTLQLRAMEELREKFLAVNVRIFGVNPADRESHEKFARGQDLKFPLLVDEGGAVARQYGALLELPFGAPRVIRTVYLVNPMRKIRLANRGSPSVAAILRSVQALQNATRAGM